MTPAFNGMLFDRSMICASCGAAVAAVIVAALALVVGRFVRGRPAPLRYGLLLAALVVLGIVPAVAAASRLGGWAALHISPSAVDRPLAARPFIARPEMPRPSPSPSPSPVVAADDDFVPPEQIHRIEKTVAAPLRMPTLREAASGLLWAWFGGLLFFVGMVIRDLVRLRLLRQTLVPCPSPAAVGLLGDAARSVGLTQPPRLFESAAVPVPVVIGPVKPVVVLPAGMANTLDHEKLTAVLLHEAAHVVHGDLWVGLLQHAVAAIFWWCPPVHRLNRRLAEVREEICDDYVVLAQGDGFQLAEVLVEMAAGLRGRRQRLTIGTLGAIDEKPALEGRVERLIDLTRKAAPMTRMNRLAVVAAGAFGLVALAIVLATTIHAANEVPDPAAIIAGIRENISAFNAFHCRYRYTVGVVPVARDGVNGPYFRRSADGLSMVDRAEPCTEISWLRNGDLQLLEERLLDRNLVQELRAGKQLSSGTDDASELFNSDFGIKISHVLQGGGLWEGGGHVRNVQTPFDFLDAEGANRSLSLANLLERSFTRDGVALVRSEERSHEGRRIAELEFVGTNGDTSHVVYTIALDEGFLPVTIEIRESKMSEKVQRYHVTERRKIDGAGWLPMRCVKVYGSANGEGPAEVAMLEVVEIKIGAPENSEFKTVLPKMYALHLGEMWDSQFINDVERPINLAEVKRLISVAKRITAAATPALRDISFDDIKLDMQKGDPFSRDLLPTRVTGLENSRVRIRGYILPSFQQTGLTQFVLVRDNMECCFGPGALLHDCVVVRMVPGKTAAFSVRPVAVTGTFRVQELRGPDGRHLAIYALDGETPVVAVDEAESGASADATGFLSQRFRLDQLLRGNADAAVVGASVPARVVGPLAGTAAEPKASAPPLGATEAEEPPAEAAAISRNPEQAKAQVPPFTLAGVVVDKSGTAVPGAVVTTRNYRGIIQATATADDQGAFEITLPVSPFARASLGPIVSAAVSDRSLLGYFRFPFHDGPSPGSDKVRIVIEPTRPAKVNVIDADGKPVEGAEVRMQLDLPISIGPSETDASGVATIQVPQSETIMSVIALKDHQGLDYEVYSLPQAQQGDQFAQRPEFPFAAGQTLILDGASPLAMRAEDGQGKPLPDVNSHVWLLRKEGRHDVMNLSFYIGLDQTTDASGSLTFAWFPKWQTEPVTIWSHATGYAYQRTNHLPTARSETVTVSMQQLIPLRGSVTLPDGKPAANIPVAAHGAGYSFDRCNASGKTDEAGRYEIFVAPNQTYMLTIADEQWAAPAQSGFVVLPEQEVPEHDFTLRPATRIHGRVLNRSTSQPVAGQLLYFIQQGISLTDIGKDLLPNPDKLNVWVCPTWQQGKTSGSDGGFEFFAAEGEYNLSTIGQTGERIVIRDESEKEIDLRVDVAAPKVLTGIVTQADTQAPVSDALIVLYPSQTTSPFEQKATSTADGRFSIETRAGPAHAFVLDKKAGLGAIAEVGAEQTAVDLPLLKLGTAHGRLLTEDGSQPAAGVKLGYAVRIKDPINTTFFNRFGGEVTTDSDGTFTLPYLVPGWDYECVCNDYPGGAMLGIAKVNVQPGESKSLGDRKKPAAPKPYVPPTLEERTLAAFRATKTPLERLEKAKKRIQDGHNNLLIVWGNPDDERVKDLMRIRFEDEAFQRYHNDYSFMSVSTASDSLEAARELATALDMPVAPSATELLLAVLDKNGEVVARLASADFCAGGSIAKDLFFAELDKHKPTPLDAHELLKQALATAQRENKRVMLLETAAWCGPCQILSGWLQRNQQWEKDYVWVKIDQRWTGATDIMKELRGEDRSIPWVGILDAAGKPLATSDNPVSGSNIGSPTTGPELDHFRHMFESTCQRMTPEEITELMKAAVVEVGR